MADIDNLVLEQSRHIRGQVDRVESKLDDLILRTGHIERSVAEHSIQLAELNVRIDRIDNRVTRIDLVET